MNKESSNVNRANILVVDDVLDNVKLLRETLIKEGYKVRPALSGKQALDAIDIEKPDLILLDLKMPEMDGYEVCNRIKSNDKTKDIPIMVVTATTDILGMVKAFDCGAVDYINKPIHKEELLVRVKTHIDLYLARKEIQSYQQTLEQRVEERTVELKKSHEIIASSTDTIICTDLEGKITLWNPAAQEMYGYTAEEVIGKSISIIYKDQEDDKLTYIIEGLMLGDVIKNIENTCVDKYGNEIIVLMSLTSLRDKEGNITELVGFSTDITDRKRIQNELNRLNLLFEETSQTAKVGGWELDFQNNMNLFTNQTYDIYELPRGELPTMEDGINYYHPDHRETVMNAVTNAIENQIPYDIEVKLITAKNNEIWVHTKGNPIIKDGKVVRLYGSIQDITERKNAEIELTKAQEIASIGCWYLNYETGEITWSKELYKMYGFDPELPIPPYEEHAKFLKPESWDLLNSQIENTANTGEPYSIELKTNNNEGDWQWVYAQGEAIFNGIGEIIGLRGIAQDITQRKLAEEKIKENEENIRFILNSLKDSVCVIDEKGNIVNVNQTWVEFGVSNELDIDAAEHLDFNYFDICKRDISDEYAGKVLYGLEEIIEGKQTEFSLEYPCHSPTEKRWFLMRAVLMKTREKRIVMSHVDITDLKLTAIALFESEKRFLNMASNMPAAIFQYLLHPDGTDSVIYANSGCFDLWELTAEQVLDNASLLWEMIHPDDVQPMMESVMKSGEEESPWYFQWRITTPSGKRKWLEGAGKPEKKENGDVLWDTVILDVTERKDADEKLAISEAGLDNAQKIARIGSFEFNFKHENTKWSKTLYEIHDMEIADSPPKFEDFLKGMIDDDANELIRLIDKAEKTGENYTLNYRYKVSNNQIRYYFVNAEVIFDDHNKPNGIKGTAQDITQLKLAELQLKEAKNSAENTKLKLQEAQRLSQIGSWEYYVEPELVNWSKELFNIFDMPNDQSAPKYSLQQNLYTEESLKNLDLAVDECVQKGIPYELELDIITATGDNKVIISKGRPIKSDKDEIIGCYGTAQDVTELKRAERELQDSKELVILKNKISNGIILSSGEEMFKTVLDIVLETFESRFGYFGYIDNENDEKLVCPSMTFDIWENCKIPDKSIEFPKSSWTGIWGESLIHKKSIFKNKGLSAPSGHVKMHNAMAVPLLYRDELIGQITIANKAIDYTSRDKNLLEDICNYISPFLNAFMIESKFKSDLMESKIKAEESDQRFQAFMDNLPARVFIKNEELRYIYGNKRMQLYAGKSDNELLGATVYDFLQKDKAKKLEDIDKKVLKNKTKVETEFLSLNGEDRWKRNIKFPIKLPNEETVVGGITFDITEKKQTELNLQEALDEVTSLKNKIQKENVYLKEEIDLAFNYQDMIYASNEISDVLNQVDMVASTNATVLLQGESGTGKEIIARAIHSNSEKSNKPLIKVNCAAIPHELIESELFGHKKGAFTGAINDRVGKFELADGGTLFLDEIGELPIDMQPKLLRALQESEIEPIGGSKTLKVDVRIIAATNRVLKEEIEKEKFREDLYFRLNVFPIIIPPLRERTDDIPVLINHFVTKFSDKYRKEIKSILKEDLDAMMKYEWPGNVRELQNFIERAVIVSQGDHISFNQGPKKNSSKKRDIKFIGKTLNDVQREHIIRTLKKTKWKITGDDGAAKILDIKPSTLRDRMKKLNIQKPN